MREPEVRMLDARVSGAGERELREVARAEAQASGARHTVRSYRHPYAVVAWHDGSVGVDIERVEPCTEAFAHLICTPEERAAAAQAEDADRFLTSLWSGKEALAKALGDALDHEPWRLASPLLWRGGRAGRWRARPLEVPDGHVGWLVWSDR